MLWDGYPRFIRKCHAGIFTFLDLVCNSSDFSSVTISLMDSSQGLQESLSRRLATSCPWELTRVPSAVNLSFSFRTPLISLWTSRNYINYIITISFLSLLILGLQSFYRNYINYIITISFLSLLILGLQSFFIIITIQLSYQH